MSVHLACTDTHACVCIPLNKCLVFYGVSRGGRESSQLRLTGRFKWTRADVGGYSIPLKQQKIFDHGLQLSFFQDNSTINVSADSLFCSVMENHKSSDYFVFPEIYVKATMSAQIKQP